MEAEFGKEQCKAGHDDAQPNAVYLFACHVLWNNHAEGISSADHCVGSNDEEVRKIAEAIPRRTSPRPKSCPEYIVKAKPMGQEHQRCLS
jgi:hypothetical protein